MVFITYFQFLLLLDCCALYSNSPSCLLDFGLRGIVFIVQNCGFHLVGAVVVHFFGAAQYRPLNDDFIANPGAHKAHHKGRHEALPHFSPDLRYYLGAVLQRNAARHVVTIWLSSQMWKVIQGDVGFNAIQDIFKDDVTLFLTYLVNIMGSS